MTKVGEDNNLPPKIETKEKNLKNLELSLFKFEEALEGYRNGSQEKQNHMKKIMDSQLGLINHSSSEILRQGVHKQEVKVEKDYRAFLENGSDESYAALKHDIQTLRDYIAPSTLYQTKKIT